MFGEAHVSWTRWFYQSEGLSNGFDITQLGFPSYLAANSITKGIPSICPGEMSCIGGYYNENDVTDRYEIEANMTKMWAKHTLKFGGTLGKGRYHMNTIDNSTGSYSSNLSFTQGPNPLEGSAASGFGFASFLLGTMSGGQQNVTEIIGHYTQPYYGLYAEDDIKVNRNLTATLGLRWDHEDPRREGSQHDVELRLQRYCDSLERYGRYRRPGIPRRQWHSQRPVGYQQQEFLATDRIGVCTRE